MKIMYQVIICCKTHKGADRTENIILCINMYIMSEFNLKSQIDVTRKVGYSLKFEAIINNNFKFFWNVEIINILYDIIFCRYV